jgi:hypothetical protein
MGPEEGNLEGPGSAVPPGALPESRRGKRGRKGLGESVLLRKTRVPETAPPQWAPSPNFGENLLETGSKHGSRSSRRCLPGGLRNRKKGAEETNFYLLRVYFQSRAKDGQFK